MEVDIGDDDDENIIENGSLHYYNIIHIVSSTGNNQSFISDGYLCYHRTAE